MAAPEVIDGYFPVVAGAGQPPTARALREAGAGWDDAAARGQRRRDEALGALGPLLAPGEVAARLGVSTSTVNNWRQRGKLLAPRLDDHQYRYPLFQFAASPAEGEQGLEPGFVATLSPLAGLSPWARAPFFLAPTAALGDETPIATLRRGDRAAAGRVRELARRAGELGG